MTSDQFKYLSLEKKADVVCKEGVLLGERENTHFEISLFGVEGFYVEVFYNKRDNDTFFEAFDNPTLLSPYLKEINIADLF